MPADPEETDRLRELHEAFAWKVNSAVAEGREDLIRRFCGEYVESAVRIMTEESRAAGGACLHEDCEVCERPRPAPPFRRGRCRRLVDATSALARRPHG